MPSIKEVSFPKVTVVIPVHNRIAQTLECLASLCEENYPNMKLIVVDDGSTDGTDKIVPSKFPEVILLKGDGNLWWTGATNLGVKKALSIKSDYVLLLNNDNVVEKGFLSPLVEFCKAHVNRIAASLVLYKKKPQIVRSGGVIIDWKRGFFTLGLHNMSLKEIDQSKPIEVDGVGGQGVLIPRQVFEKAGFFDERWFPHYAADVDFSLRVRKMGYKIFILPMSLVWDDTDSTGLRPVGAKIPLRKLPLILFSRRSPTNFITSFRLYQRYSESRPIWVPLMQDYMRFIKGCLSKG
jgi:GT2 family glycosyltransferase